MENLKKTVSRNIIYLRTLHRLTQSELGEKLNYSDKSVSKWERAEAVPDAYILKRMSELFHVSVDYLVNDHSEDDLKPPAPADSNHPTITKIAIIGVWTLALLVFVVLWLLERRIWLVFVYAVPVSMIVLLVFNSLWGNRRNNFFIITALVWSILAAIYLTFLRYNWWVLFLLGIPSEAIIYLCFKIRRNGRIHLPF